MSDATPTADLGALLAGIEDLSGTVSRNSRFWAGVALITAPVAWVLMLRRWIFDGIGPFLAWLPLLVVMMVPGVLLFGFASRVRRLGALPDRVSGEIAELVQRARSDGGVSPISPAPGSAGCGACWHPSGGSGATGTVSGASWPASPAPSDSSIPSISCWLRWRHWAPGLWPSWRSWWPSS